MTTLRFAVDWAMAASTAFKQCCEPGLSALGADFFHFVRVDERGKRAMLCTHPLWLDHCVEHDLLQTPLVTMLNEQLPTGEYTWLEFDQNDPILQHGRDYLGLKTGLSIIIRQAHVSYGYHFGDTLGHQTLNPWCQQQWHTLYRFILMFHDKAESLLQQAYLHAWQMDTAIVVQPQPLLTDPQLPQHASITSDLHYDRWMLPWQDSALQLSSREMECLAGLMQGLTAKQIAKRLGISYRTVQTHWERIRMKVGTRSCHDLVAVMRRSGLSNLIAQSFTQR